MKWKVDDNPLTASRGQVVSMRVKTDGGDEFVPVEIPAEFSHLNIEREQKLRPEGRVRQGGIPVVTAINRL